VPPSGDTGPKGGAPEPAPAPDPERSYYLSSFRGKVLVLGAGVPEAAGECRSVAADLVAAGVAVVVVVPGADETPVGPDTLVRIWESLARGSAEVARRDPLDAAAAVACGGRVHKLVLVAPDVVVQGSGGDRRSFVDVGRSGLPARLQHLARPLYEGVDGVNLVPPGSLATELFTYEGAGTLLTKGEYGEVRRLGFDDYEAVLGLLHRGAELGYLRPRSETDFAALLPRALGFFAAGHQPAGVVALASEPYAGSGLGELEALFTISRFHGEGVGRRLVDALDEEAARAGLDGLFAVTASDDAAAFFESCGYREVGRDSIPAAKWAGYPPERLRSVRSFLHML